MLSEYIEVKQTTLNMQLFFLLKITETETEA